MCDCKWKNKKKTKLDGDLQLLQTWNYLFGICLLQQFKDSYSLTSFDTGLFLMKLKHQTKMFRPQIKNKHSRFYKPLLFSAKTNK